MATETQRARVSPTTREILQRQAANAERNRAQNKPAAAKPAATGTAVTPAKSAAVAVPDNRTPQQAYLDEIAPAALVGRLIKFSKDGEFITVDDETPIPEDADFIALCDETLVGWQKFFNDGTPPERHMGLLYGDVFIMPARETLGDMDPADWPAGLSGAPEDPWRHFMFLVLQNTASGEMHTFSTSSKTGRRAVGNLLRHYERLKRSSADELPIVRLKAGGFQHRDERIGFVPTPVFGVVGRAPRGSAAKPDTSTAADMNDELPF